MHPHQKYICNDCTFEMINMYIYMWSCVMDPLLPQYQFSNFSKGFFTVLPHDHPPEPLRFKPWNFLCATFSSYGNFDRRFLELGSGWEWGSREVKMWLAYGIWFFNCNFFWSNFMSSKVCVFFNVPTCLPCPNSWRFDKNLAIWINLDDRCL